MSYIRRVQTKKTFLITSKAKRWAIDLGTGDSRFKQQIIDDVLEEEIPVVRKAALGNYKQMRKRFLIYSSVIIPAV